MSRDARSPALTVRDLTVRFRRPTGAITVVRGVDFDLARGEVLSVIGESGSGKSVMLRALLGILPSSAQIEGVLEIEGKDVTRLDPVQRGALRGKVISMVFQEPSTALDPVYTVGQQIVETILCHEDVSCAAAARRSLELLDMVAIPSAQRRLDSFPHELSGGMRQRVMIALALACRPAILLADEPTTALDATVQIQLLVLLRELQRELDMALIFVTHDLGVAAEISDRIAVMYAGRFVEIGSAEAVLLSPSHPYSRALLGATVHSGMRGRRLDTIPGGPPDLRVHAEGCAFAPRCVGNFADCDRLPPMRAAAQDHDSRCWLVQPNGA